MLWRLDGDHQIDEQILPEGTVIGDETQWPFRATKADPKINRKVGDPLPPSTQMTPLDDEARKVFKAKFGTEAPNKDPLASIPLTGAQNAPKVLPKAVPPVAPVRAPVNVAPADEGSKVGMVAEKPKA